MTRETNTVLANGLLALSKALSVFMFVWTTGSLVKAVVPISATILLVVAAVLLWNGKRIGAAIAVPVIAYFVVQFFTFGAGVKMILYLLIHVFAILLNVASWIRLGREIAPPRQQS